MKPLDLASLSALHTVIGPDRLAPYIAACGADQTRAMRLYTWNIEASSAVLGAFAALEVGVRNAMHTCLARHFGQEDWWEVATLSTNDRAQIEDAIHHLDRKRGRDRWRPGHIVAELKVSFWEALLANRYHAALWTPALRGAFPNFTGRRGELRAQLERLRMLRNRAAHHEPIHARDLAVDHRYMCIVAGSVSADLRMWVATHSRLPMIVAARSDTIHGSRRTRF